MGSLTVYLPTYERPDHLGQALAAVLASDVDDLRVVILDNASTADYSAFAAHPDRRVRYERRPENLGATGNILEALSRPHGTDHVAVFHDDDLVHPRYFALAVAALDEDAELRWVASELQSFEGEEPRFAAVPGTPRRLVGDAGVALAIVEGSSLAFGSVVYRAGALQALDLRGLERFSIAFDRPLLLRLAAGGAASLFDDAFVAYRHHPAQDSKSGVLRADHVLAVLGCYRDAIGDGADRSSVGAMHAYGARQVVASWRRLPKDDRPSLPAMVRRAHAADIMRYRDLRVVLGDGIRSRLRSPR